MPHVTISMFPGRDAATKEQIAKEMRAAIVKAMSMDENLVSVSIHDVPKEDWADEMAQIPDEEYVIRVKG